MYIPVYSSLVIYMNNTEARGRKSFSEKENLKKKLAFYIEKDYNEKRLKSPAKKKNLIRPNAFSDENVCKFMSKTYLNTIQV